ncbi:condensation domain-containing protein [Cellulomonas wangsupingiae]|uniref:Condensation domain-containing protein n=1 Tax=Cellulomonas wangsupingiae TaxID=2968085 RepID=A0ABY5K8Z7_9CELL|nr:condensation domain-containing protein [Cellulomonas wangsupingiae]MCC2333033.1 condensation domain-containing protein [Cellulomonas wangsupingiae]UUI66749.1 condensation domain-containing protein [Cellulomonas wangsupingiae]
MPTSTSGRTVPLSPSQELLWEFMSALCPHDPAGSRELTVEHRRLTGALDPDVLLDALGDVVRRHDPLRLVVDAVGPQPTLRVLDDVEPLVEVVDLSGTPASERDARVADLADADRRRTFDLARGPLWSVTLVRLAADEHLLLLSFCHLVGDGWSAKVLVEDLVAAYAARQSLGPHPAPLDLDWDDLVRLQRATLPQEPARAEYWRSRLAPAPPYHAFPFDPPGPDSDLTGEVAYPFRFTPDVSGRLRAVAWRARTSPYVALMAAYHVLVASRTGRTRVVIGTTTLGRDTPESRRMVGQFTNDVCVPLVVRPEASLLDVVAEAHAAMAEAAANVMPFQALARAVNPSFDEQRPWPDNHLFDSYLQSAVPASAPLVLPGLRIEQTWLDDDGRERPPVVTGREVPPGTMPVWVKRGAPIVVVDDDRAGGVMIANVAFYPAALVDGLVADYVRIVEALVEDPDRPVGGLVLASADA